MPPSSRAPLADGGISKHDGHNQSATESILSWKSALKKRLRQNGRTDFLSKQRKDAKILDVGCGSNSPFIVKSILPDSHYTGIDVSDFNHTKPVVADEYILTTSNEFTARVNHYKNHFDTVISSHNLEHCEDREGTLKAMLESLKIGGEIYLSFPSEQSIDFPNRSGCLNYFDDSTHKFLPPNFTRVISTIEDGGFVIIYSAKNYSPFVLRCIGWLLEPLSSLKEKVMIGTWEFYGFETKILAKKVR